MTEEQEKKRTKPPHEPSERTRNMVSAHAIVGTPQEIIADLLGVDPKTLRKYYRTELTTSAAKATAKIAQSLYQKALAGDISAMIFWMKTKGRWATVKEVDVKSSDGSMSPVDTSSAVLEAIRAKHVTGK